MSESKNQSPETHLRGTRTYAAVEAIIPLLDEEASLSPATRRAMVDLVSAFERDKYNLPVDAPIAFGLEAQGHIPAVEAALAEGADWQEIGRRVGWDGETAKAYYERHLARAAIASEGQQ